MQIAPFPPSPAPRSTRLRNLSDLVLLIPTEKIFKKCHFDDEVSLSFTVEALPAGPPPKKKLHPCHDHSSTRGTHFQNTIFNENIQNKPTFHNLQAALNNMTHKNTNILNHIYNKWLFFK